MRGRLFSYDTDDRQQPAVSLLLRPEKLTYSDSDLFPSMDMNLPEGFLMHEIMERFPKKKLNKMHLLAMMGDNAIGRIGYSQPGAAVPTSKRTMDKKTLLETPMTPAMFKELVDAYLSSGICISGVQPKIMIPTKMAMPIPDLIVKTAGPEYPGLAANEYLCLRAAQLAGISVPGFDLSDDGKLLVIDRFDIRTDGSRIGFEDLAALMALRVNDRLDNRKYTGNYELVAETIGLFSTNRAEDLHRFFQQLCLSIMVRNGDGHLKNYGMLYDGPGDSNIRLSPLYDVVTTTIYTYERPGGFQDVDRTMALKFRRGKHAKTTYPTTAELMLFGREVCGVVDPGNEIVKIGAAMSDTLSNAIQDKRIESRLVSQIAEQWELGLALAIEAKPKQQATASRKFL